jgi:DNA-binding SARP family transcriptional activator
MTETLPTPFTVCHEPCTQRYAELDTCTERPELEPSTELSRFPDQVPVDIGKCLLEVSAVDLRPRGAAMALNMSAREFPEPASKPGWRLSLMGAWRLTVAGRSVSVGTNGQRLFALLALRGTCERSYMAGVLWPDRSEPQAHGNLRATLSRLHRRGLAEPLQYANGALSLRHDVLVDVWNLIATASAVLDGSLPTVGWPTVRALAGDDLLVGWYDEWLLLERERLRQMRLHALEALSGQLVAAGDMAAAVHAALAAVAVEPLRESAHRALIHAHLAEGNRVEALRQLGRLRHLLREELGVEPSLRAVDLLR